MRPVGDGGEPWELYSLETLRIPQSRSLPSLAGPFFIHLPKPFSSVDPAAPRGAAPRLCGRAAGRGVLAAPAHTPSPGRAGRQGQPLPVGPRPGSCCNQRGRGLSLGPSGGLAPASGRKGDASLRRTGGRPVLPAATTCSWLLEPQLHSDTRAFPKPDSQPLATGRPWHPQQV